MQICAGIFLAYSHGKSLCIRYIFYKVFVHLIFMSYLQQSWKPISVGPAVQAGTTVLP